MNIRDRRTLHHVAKQKLADAQGDSKKILLIYLGVITALSLGASILSVVLSNRIANTGGLGNMGLRSALSTAKALLPLAQSLVLLGLELGYCAVALKIIRGESFSNDTLFGGFRRFFPYLRMQVLLGAIYFTVAFMSVYASTYIFLMLPVSKKFTELATPLMESVSILNSTVTFDEATMMTLTEAMMPMMWIFIGMFLLVFIPLHYQYRMAVYRLIDQPKPGALRAVLESRMMMRRNRFALLQLDLNFWWFYVMQAVIMIICYGDMILIWLGITLPWSATVSYFLFLSLSLIVQFAVYYFSMNRIAATYAAAYESLLPNEIKSQDEPKSPTVPWQNQY